MFDPQLLDYIRKSKEAGISIDTIRQNLVANGWQLSAITDALAYVQAPVIPKAPGFASPETSSVFGGTHTRPLRNYPLYSYLSVLLAFVLFFGLFILSNKAIGDVGRHFKGDVTSALIVETLIILPFLIAAFALHFGLTVKGEKYKILSYPYYIISSLLLVKLLFHVSAYILSTQVVYGVYLVLILIVTVLTLGVVFVQKYMKNKP